MKLEKNFQKRVMQLLHQNGSYRLNIVPDGVVVGGGTPDIIACIHGIFCGLELKRGHKYKATGRQIIHLKQIRDAGGVGIVLIDSPNWKKELLDIIEMIKCGNDEKVNKMYPLPAIKW